MKIFSHKILSNLLRKKNLIEWLLAICIAVFVVLFIGTFIIESYTIPTTSMEKTLIEGDHIVVSKLNYGARTPITLLTLPFFSKLYSSLVELPYYRLPGFSHIKSNDVIVFNYPIEDDVPVDKRTPFVKRCVAVAGDTLKIINGKVFINANLLAEPENAEFNFLVKTDSVSPDQDELYKLGVTEGGPVNNLSTYNLTMSRSTAIQVAKLPHVVKTEVMCEDSALYAENLFPSSMYYPWNMDNYGPIVVPSQGMTITLNKITIPLYYRIISIYEDNELLIKNDSICTINGEPARTYTFKMNYYFAMGDNRHNSADSRSWGFIPEDHIIGKAVMILFSIDHSKGFFGKIRWNRCFKMIE